MENNTGEKIKLRDLINAMLFVDKLYIYEAISAGEFKDLFIGNISDVPENILARDVVLIAARRKGNLDIRIEPFE